MILCNKQIKALIRLRGCAGWSAPLLFAKPRRQVFSCQGLYILLGNFEKVTDLVKCFYVILGVTHLKADLSENVLFIYGLCSKNNNFVVCQLQMCRPACTSVQSQSDQHLYYL